MPHVHTVPAERIVPRILRICHERINRQAQKVLLLSIDHDIIRQCVAPILARACEARESLGEGLQPLAESDFQKSCLADHGVLDNQRLILSQASSNNIEVDPSSPASLNQKYTIRWEYSIFGVPPLVLSQSILVEHKGARAFTEAQKLRGCSEIGIH